MINNPVYRLYIMPYQRASFWEPHLCFKYADWCQLYVSMYKILEDMMSYFIVVGIVATFCKKRQNALLIISNVIIMLKCLDC